MKWTTSGVPKDCQAQGPMSKNPNKIYDQVTKTIQMCEVHNTSPPLPYWNVVVYDAKMSKIKQTCIIHSLQYEN